MAGQGHRRSRHIGLFSVVLVLVGLVVGQGAANADAPAAQSLPWQNPQSSSPVVRGTFKQERHLAELDQPLVSTGTFVVAREQGLIWQVEQPLSTRLIITRQQLVESSDGRETARIDASEQPGLAVVAAVLLAVFEGDMQRLSQFFHIERSEIDAGQTRVILEPIRAAVGEFVQRVRIQGSQRIERLRIDQPGGDYSVIDLKTSQDGTNAAPDRLSPDEQAAFAR